MPPRRLVGSGSCAPSPRGTQHRAASPHPAPGTHFASGHPSIFGTWVQTFSKNTPNPHPNPAHTSPKPSRCVRAANRGSPPVCRAPRGAPCSFSSHPKKVPPETRRPRLSQPAAVTSARGFSAERPGFLLCPGSSPRSTFLFIYVSTRAPRRRGCPRSSRSFLLLLPPPRGVSSPGFPPPSSVFPAALASLFFAAGAGSGAGEPCAAARPRQEDENMGLKLSCLKGGSGRVP